MITFYDIKIWSKDSLPKQIEKLSNGKYYLNDGEKWEKQRIELNSKYFNAEINIKEFEKKSIILIENVLSNIIENYNFENLPF